MRRVFLFILIGMVFSGVGCSDFSSSKEEFFSNVLNSEGESETLVADFEPASGAAPSPKANPKAEGPWNGRFLTAVSDDGLTWEKTQEIVGDQLNVPDLEYGPDDVLYLYFTGHTVGDLVNATAVALSDDEGKTWYFKYLTFDGVDGYPADISAFYSQEKELFFAYGNYIPLGGTKSTALFTSSDGIHFTFVETVFSSDPPGMVPGVLVIGEEVHLYTNTGGMNTVQHAVSRDGGYTFDRVDDFKMEIGRTSYFASNAVAVDGGYRMYAYDRGLGNITAFFSTDGYDWSSEGVVLEVDLPYLESTFVKDPAVVQLRDGSWFMVYPTNIPD